MNILQFENATMQALHEKAATAANASVAHGPFVGGWWEQYLAVVIETSQAEQRVAGSKDVAEIRGFYDQLAAELDSVTKDRDALRVMHEERGRADALRAQLTKDQADVIASLHKQLAQAAAVNDTLKQQLEDLARPYALPVTVPVDAEALHDTAIDVEHSKPNPFA